MAEQFPPIPHLGYFYDLVKTALLVAGELMLLANSQSINAFTNQSQHEPTVAARNDVKTRKVLNSRVNVKGGQQLSDRRV